MSQEKVEYPAGKGKKLNLNLDRLKEVSGKALEMQAKKKFPFDQENLYPDAIIPDPERIKAGSPEHAEFLFHACSLDSRVSSRLVYEGIRNLVLNYDYIAEKTFSNSRTLEKDYQESSKAGSGGKKWKPWEQLEENDGKIMDYVNEMSYENWRGDDETKPHVMGLQGKTLEETIKNLQNFKGVGPGIANLITKNFVKFGIWEYHPSLILPKVDRHVMRIALGTGIIELRGKQKEIHHSSLLKPLYDGLGTILKEENWSGVDLDDSLYVIGEQICRLNKLYKCDEHCLINCDIRPKLDKKATLYSLEESRYMVGSLFQ